MSEPLTAEEQVIRDWLDGQLSPSGSPLPPARRTSQPLPRRQVTAVIATLIGLLDAARSQRWEAERQRSLATLAAARPAPAGLDVDYDAALDVDYDEDNHWLVENDGHGASRIVARDVLYDFGRRVARDAATAQQREGPLLGQASDTIDRQGWGLDVVIEWSAAEDAYGDAVKGLPPEQWDGATRDTPEWTALRAARDRQRAAYSALRALAEAQQREGAGESGSIEETMREQAREWNRHAAWMAQQREGAGE